MLMRYAGYQAADMPCAFRFLVTTYIPAVEVDINTMATRPIEDLSDATIPFPIYMLTRNDYMLYVFPGNDIMILIDVKLLHKFDFTARVRFEKSKYLQYNKWHQQFRDNVYMIGRENNLYSICWTDIEHGIPVVPKQIDSHVEDSMSLEKAWRSFIRTAT